MIRDDRIAKFMEADLDAKSQWPDPWLSLNPFFADGGSVADLVAAGLLRPECERIFQTGKTEAAATLRRDRRSAFYRHQRDGDRGRRAGASYVLTTGTGSGQVAGLHRADRGPGAAGPGQPGTRRSGSGRSSSTR